MKGAHMATIRRAVATVLGVMLVLTAAACDEVSIDIDIDGVRGSGTVATEMRDVAGFDEIVVFGSGTVDISVTATESLTIEAEDNILPLLTTNVSGSRLELGSREAFSATREIVYTITVIDLTRVEINGSADVTAVGLDTEAFRVEINGSGDIQPEGTASRVEVAINGSGNYDGVDLATPDASVRISGSGSVVVNATETLDVEISGSGDVEYLGDPELTESVTGSGDVSRR
jgi:hypothetical protein